jgi:hypothetical protein
MGHLIRAAAGFAIALTLLHGPSVWSGLKTPSLLKVQADIEASHPGAQLKASMARFMATQNSTTSAAAIRQ